MIGQHGWRGGGGESSYMDGEDGEDGVLLVRGWGVGEFLHGWRGW